MSKTWYPIIDHEKCVECGTCINFCPHDVYDKEKNPFPEVLLPDACVQRCHGCGNICPAGAITYQGDDTGWTPPCEIKEHKSDSGCSCGDDCEEGCSCGGDCGC